MHHTLAKIASTMDTVRCGVDNRLSFKFAEFKSYYVEPKNILYVANLYFVTSFPVQIMLDTDFHTNDAVFRYSCKQNFKKGTNWRFLIASSIFSRTLTCLELQYS